MPGDPSRDALLYVTPLTPRESGNGLAMRAASLLDPLARRFDIHLFVAPVSGETGPVEEAVIRRTARIGRLDLTSHLDPLFRLIDRIPDPATRARAELAYPKPHPSRFCTPGAALALEDWSRSSPPAAIQVMRLYLAPLAEPFLRRQGTGRPYCVLDLDDDEVSSHVRLSRLHAVTGDVRAAAIAQAEATKYRELAEHYFPLFDRILVCSDADAARLSAAYPAARFSVVPNAYRAIDRPEHIPAATGPLRLLFVGNLGYFPNIDAVLFLCRDILPELRRRSGRNIRIDIAGNGNIAALRSRIPDEAVTFHGGVGALAPLYAAADIAVVPLRVGGGTRIKLLEAFAYGVPAVTTGLGREGIDVIDGIHALSADTAGDFADACLRVKENPELAARLARNAAGLLEDRYSPARIEDGIAEAYAAFSSNPADGSAAV